MPFIIPDIVIEQLRENFKTEIASSATSEQVVPGRYVLFPDYIKGVVRGLEEAKFQSEVQSNLNDLEPSIQSIKNLGKDAFKVTINPSDTSSYVLCKGADAYIWISAHSHTTKGKATVSIGTFSKRAQWICLDVFIVENVTVDDPGIVAKLLHDCTSKDALDGCSFLPEWTDKITGAISAAIADRVLRNFFPLSDIISIVGQKVSLEFNVYNWSYQDWDIVDVSTADAVYTGTNGNISGPNFPVSLPSVAPSEVLVENSSAVH
ncbi:hypothetical protein C0991_008529 [Blastosporella zonata]|nr:hypothetical protein C0991_008529 [Blastosporella zonata]